MSKLCDCGVLIDFIKTKSGKKMPVELEYLDHDQAPAGTVLVTDEGDVLLAKSGLSKPGLRGREPHFAKCPLAGTFRRPR